MKKTLLSALKHGSGIIFILLAMMLGGSLQAWGGTLPRNQVYYFHFENNVPITDQQITSSESSDKNHYSCSFIVPGSSSSYNFTIYCSSNGSYYRKADANFNESSETEISIDAVSGNIMKLTPIVSSGYVQIDVDMYCTYDNDSRLTISQTAVRYFSAGEYIYLRNIKPESNWSEYWIDSNTQYAYLYMWGGTAGTHTYRFNLVDGTAYTADAIYGAQIATAGYYANFKLTRGDAECSDGAYPSSVADATGDVTFDATKNYIYSYNKNVTSVTWDVFNPCTEPTVTTASSPAAKGATTATLTGSYTTEDVCVPTAKGVAYKEDGGAYSYQPDGTSASGSINISISDLTPLTTYYYKAYVELEGGKKLYGAEYNFTTDCGGGIVISTQPSSSAQDGCLGSATALSVTASGASDYTYQWYYNSTASVLGATAIHGATASSYTPAVVGTNYYYCSVGAAGGYCEVSSNFSGAITIKGVPSLTATPSSVTNYAPVTITASGAEISSWSITSGTGGYLYKKSATSAKFKGNVGSSSTPVTYTIQGTANGCSGSTTVTVNKNADSCE